MKMRFCKCFMTRESTSTVHCTTRFYLFYFILFYFVLFHFISFHLFHFIYFISFIPFYFTLFHFISQKCIRILLTQHLLPLLLFLSLYLCSGDNRCLALTPCDATTPAYFKDTGSSSFTYVTSFTYSLLINCFLSIHL